MAIFVAVSLLLSAALLVKLADLQVVQGAALQREALVNRVHRIPLTADRGVIYDRQGKPLAVNQPSFSVQVTIAALPVGRMQREAEIAELARLSGGKAADFQARLDLADDPYRPVDLRDGLTAVQAQAVQERLPHLPGAHLADTPVRRYLEPQLFAHVLGYTGKIDGDTYRKLKPLGYLPDESVGKAGLEEGLESVLRGRDGWEDVETDADGQVVRVLRMQPPVGGQDVYISIDEGLQQEAAKQLQDGLTKAGSRAGAYVAVDPRDGEVLALVSYPSYDDNLFAAGISQADYDRLLNDPGKPLYDRAIAGEYPPGSTFKMITGIAGLQEGVITANTILGCPAHLSFGSWTYWNWAHYDLGPMNVEKAIPTSCDTFFYQVADRLGPDRLAAYASQFGYGQVTGIELPGQAAGVAPTPDYKLQVCPYPAGTPDCGWNEGDTVTYGIGQSYVLATPLIEAMYAATMANGGTLLRPTLVHRVTDSSGKLVREAEPHVVREVDASPDNIQLLRQGMNQCLNGPWGTAAIAKSEGFHWDGGCKTGTAQFGGSGVDLPSHAWFIDFAPMSSPRYASATILENGGFGEYTAEPASIPVLNYFLSRADQIAP